MKFSNFVRQHWAAFRALLVLTVITGLAYPLVIWLVAQVPGLHDKAKGSIITVDGKPVGSRLIGQLFTDKDGNALPQYFQSRPSAAGHGYDPPATERKQPGPGEHRRHPRPTRRCRRTIRADAGFKPSLLTQVCSRSDAVGQLEAWTGRARSAPGDGVGAVLSVIGPRDAHGNVVHPTRWSASTSRVKRRRRRS